jgi:hypothetical protein
MLPHEMWDSKREFKYLVLLIGSKYRQDFVLICIMMVWCSLDRTALSKDPLPTVLLSFGPALCLMDMNTQSFFSPFTP